ncbi:MAG TPA: hypothetical protein VK752_15750 [Bryobacteraceae bacterium]|nr:hypothetical protein [Bryobacteraceae bacterium]
MRQSFFGRPAVRAQGEDCYGQEIISIISARAAEAHDIRRYQEQAMDWRGATGCAALLQAAGGGERLRVNVDDIPRLTDGAIVEHGAAADVREPKIAVSMRLDLPGT